MSIALAGGIVLTILKVILVLLLVIILLLFLIAGLTLFVPFRYKVRAEKYDAIKAEGRVSWLLGIICVIFTYDDGASSYKLKIFGADYKKLTGIFKRKKKARKDNGYSLESAEYKEDSREESYGEKKEAEKKETEKAETEKTYGMEASKPRVKNSETGDGDAEAFRGSRTDEEKKDYRTDSSSSKARNGREEKEGHNGKPHQEKSTGESWKDTRKDSVTDKIKGFRKSFKENFEKAGRIKDFIFSEITKGIVCVARDNVLHLLKKIKPRKIKSDILFGTGDPCLTGQALGAIAVYMAMTGTFFNITPDFENQVLRGRFEVSGHIRIVTLLFIVLKILLSSEWKNFYKEAMKIKEEL